MLTPIQLKEKKFQQSGRNAYRSDDVDVFMRDVLASYEQMFRENGELLRRVSLLAERLEQYKEDEDSIKSAVITAQRAADKIVKEAAERADLLTKEASDILTAAKSEAETIRRDTENSVRTELRETLENARNEAASLIDKANKEAKDLVLKAEEAAKDLQGAANRAVTSESILYDMLKKEVSDFKSEVMAKYKTHIEMISHLPEIAGQKAADAAPKVAAEPITPEISGEESVSENPVVEEPAPEKPAVPDALSAPEEPAADGFDGCINLTFDTSEPDIEFINSEEETFLAPFEEYAPPPAQRTVPVREPELVLDTPIPFKTDEESAKLEFVSDEEPTDDVLDVNAFLESYEEKPADSTPHKKRGFSLNMSKLSGSKEESKPEPASGELADDLFGSAEETEPPVFDSRHTADVQASPAPEVDTRDDEDDEAPGKLFGGRRDDLKKRFSVINIADSPGDNDDGDDDDDDPPSLRSLFKKKK